MDVVDGIITAGRQAGRALAEIITVIQTHGWAFYRHLSFEQFTLLIIFFGALFGPSYFKRVFRSRRRMRVAFARLSTSPIYPELGYRASLRNLTSLPPAERKCGLVYLGWLFGPPIGLLMCGVAIWFLGRP